MTEIHIVDGSNRRLYEPELDQHFRLRHTVFVEELGWSELRRPDGREIDRYDDPASTYLLAIDGGRVVGALRLRATEGPHLLADVFPHLVQRGPVPRGPDTLECTRYFVVRERRMGRTDCRLLAAVQQFCIARGVRELTAVVEMWWLPRWAQVGFRTRPLGLPVQLAGQPCLAVSIEMSEACLASVRGFAGLRGPALVDTRPRPFGGGEPRHATTH